MSGSENKNNRLQIFLAVIPVTGAILVALITETNKYLTSKANTASSPAPVSSSQTPPSASNQTPPSASNSTPGAASNSTPGASSNSTTGSPRNSSEEAASNSTTTAARNPSDEAASNSKSRAASNPSPTPSSDQRQLGVFIQPSSNPSPTPSSNSTPSPSSNSTLSPSSDATPSPSSDATPIPSSNSTPGTSSNSTPSPSSDATPIPSSEATPSPSSDATPSPSSDATPVESPTPQTSANLVADPGFESQKSSTVSDSWSSEPNTEVIEIGDGNPHSGNNNARLHGNSGLQTINQWVNVKPNTEYQVSAYIRTSSNVLDGFLSVNSNPAEKGSKATIKEDKYGSLSNYEQRSVVFNSGDNSKVLVSIGYSAPNEDSWIQIDDVSVTESGL